MVTLILGWVLSAGLPTPPCRPRRRDSIATPRPAGEPRGARVRAAAMRCAQVSGLGVDATRLAFIDYSRPSTEPRLWVFDLATATGCCTRKSSLTDAAPARTSPRSSRTSSGSHASSLGLFLTRETYQGRNGYSLRMDGLEPGVNDAALERAIVMHGAALRGSAVGREAGPPRPQLRLPRPCARRSRAA